MSLSHSGLSDTVSDRELKDWHMGVGHFYKGVTVVMFLLFVQMMRNSIFTMTVDLVPSEQE